MKAHPNAAVMAQALAAAASKKGAPAQTLTEQQVHYMRHRRSDAPEALDFAHKKGEALSSMERDVAVPTKLAALPYLDLVSTAAARQSADRLKKARPPRVPRPTPALLVFLSFCAECSFMLLLPCFSPSAVAGMLMRPPSSCSLLVLVCTMCVQ